MKNVLYLAVLILFTSVVKAQDKPNIVFYITDDQSQQDASIYGGDDLRTPNMERLASMGMTFDQAFVASPSCAPSRAALLTGLMPARNGAEANHNLSRSRYPIINGETATEWISGDCFRESGTWPMNKKSNFDYCEAVPKRGDLSGKVKAYLENHPTNKPRCILVGDKRPHVLWTEKMDYDPEEVNLPNYFIDTKKTRQHWVRYLTDITGMDKEPGEVIDLTKRRFGDDFLFLFSSDHGAQWPFAKWNLYDAGIRIPLIVAWPGHIEGGSRTDAMVSWVDIFPTLLDLTGGAIPDGLDGRSFASVLKGDTDKHRKYIFTTHSGDGDENVYPIRSVRTDRYKYILNLLPQALSHKSF